MYRQHTHTHTQNTHQSGKQLSLSLERKRNTQAQTGVQTRHTYTDYSRIRATRRALSRITPRAPTYPLFVLAQPRLLQEEVLVALALAYTPHQTAARIAR